MAWEAPKELRDSVFYPFGSIDKEMTREPSELYRFVKEKYFFKEPHEFVRNFSGTKGHFKSDGRFTPSSGLFGFYFGNTMQVAASEIIYHVTKDSWPLEGNPHFHATRWSERKILKFLQKQTGERYVLLRIRPGYLSPIVDFTNPRFASTYFHKGTLKIKGPFEGLYEYWIDYLVSMVTPVSSTTILNVLGFDAFSLGHVGIAYPSTRALLFDGNLPPDCLYRLDLWSLITELEDGEFLFPSTQLNAMEGFFHAEKQLQQDFNVVVFDDNMLIQSIDEMIWVSMDAYGTIINPLCDATNDEIEATRLGVRDLHGMGLMKAARSGLLSKEERTKEFASHFGFIRDR